MRHAASSFLAAALCHTTLFHLSVAHAQALQARALTAEHLVGPQVIVGRAVCLGATWLLTDAPDLTRVSPQGPAVSSKPVRGLRKDEKPWGLACLPNGELWTLVTNDTLARLDADATIAERLRLERPRLGLFTAGERLLLQHAPAATTKPLLAAGLPRRLSAFVPWPSPLSQPAPSRAEVLKANLVNCGIGDAGYVPCWLSTQTRLTISDGSVAHTSVQDLRFVRTGSTDEETPIWDVALGGASVWVLASARGAPDGRRVGGRLTKSNRRGADGRFVDLSPAARLILWANQARSVVLSSSGQLVEVSE
jgi:hypothetical protein